MSLIQSWRPVQNIGLGSGAKRERYVRIGVLYSVGEFPRFLWVEDEGTPNLFYRRFCTG
jgi:hypothetical protein